MSVSSRLLLVGLACLGGPGLVSHAQVSLRIGTNVELSRPAKSRDVFSFDGYKKVAVLADSSDVYQVTGRYDQIRDNQYTSLPGASFHLRVAWPIGERFGILTGTNVRFEALGLRYEYSSELVPVADGRLDTVARRPPGTSTAVDVYRGCQPGGFGYSLPIPFRNVYLGVPLGVEYAAIPKFLWVSIGGQVEAPLYASYPTNEPRYRFEERDGKTQCSIEYVRVKNTSGRYIRNLQYGANVGARLAINKNTLLTAQLTGQFTDVFVDSRLQGNSGNFLSMSPDDLTFDKMTYKPQRLAIGLMWTLVGPREKGIDL